MIPYCLQATFFISFVCSVPSAALTHSVGCLPAFNILLRLPQRQHPGATHKSSPGSCQPSLLFPPHKAHASPVNRCSSFVVSKQSCQTIAAAAINLFIIFYGIAAPAMPFGCSASLRSLACCLQFLLIPHGSYCVLHATSFITSFVPLHYTTFAAKPFCCKAGHTKPHTKQYTWDAPAFPQVIPAILTGFHSASLRHSFTSVAFSPPAALFSFARRQPHLGCVHLATANCSCRTSTSQSIAKVHLHSSAASVP